jgi:hypothetical protein
MKMTAEEYTKKVGTRPEQDDLSRVNCEHAGKLGHSSCGWCERHDNPRFMCGCPVSDWEFIYKGHYYYWKHKDGYYQCTQYGDMPTTESGYPSLLSLMQLKDEPHVSFIEVRQMLSSN